ACTGCGETPYVKLITQLYGDRMMIANATGCTSIWGASAPSVPYCKDENGRGPSWSNSLFEDNAEYGLGMALGVRQLREKIALNMESIIATNPPAELKAALTEWINNMDDGEKSRELSDKVVLEIGKAKLSGDAKALADDILAKKDFLVKKSVWCIGGDGWAYDIGYGGLDHVIASGEDINLLVLDTEVYSNTGGQASKSTPTAAIAKFAASGKKIKKKDLGMMAMNYGYVYVAQVAMGSDYNQFMKAIIEAESYKGPSVVICYAPCVAHGLKNGMGKSIENMKDAVDCGYWHLYRYNPLLKNEGKNPFTLDSKAPTASFRDFILDQVRYSSLMKDFPAIAEQLFASAEESAKERYESYKAKV
ncbi:MAG: thiamine pyrophosphate-dependent enzyme, partial [Clostridiales bacterium]|nr:thiamine pyrophosphate-dependent enzyme [Clostridiales bacterium]